MPVLPRLVSFWRTLFQRGRLERELDEELGQFLEASVERKLRSGLDPAAARRAALLELGSLEGLKQELRDARLGHALETTLLDVRYAGRSLRRSPAVSLVAVLTLALGVAGSTAIFSIVRGLLLPPLPYGDSGRLAFVWADLTNAGYPRGPLAGPELQDLRERSRLFSGFAGIWPNTAALTGDAEPEQLRVGLVTSDFFSVLGADAALGRTFDAGDDAFVPGALGLNPASPPVILLSWELWQRRYAGDASLVGRPILVEGAPATVVGVMPAGFKLLLPADANVPDELQAFRLLPAGIARAPRGQQFLRVVGRMRPGVSLADAREEVAAIGAQVARESADYTGSGWRLFAVGLQRVDPGFRSDHALSFRVALGARYRAPQANNAFSRQLETALRALPGVTAAGGVSHLPYDNLPNWSTPYLPLDAVERSQAREADARAITPGYFEAVGARLVEGRGFTEDDDGRGPVVAIVDEGLARRLWPHASAVGRQLLADPLTSGSPETRVTVVGVVRHLRHRRPTLEVREQIYFPQRQVLRRPLAYVVRTAGDPTGLAPAVGATLARLDPALPVYDVRPLSEYASDARAVRRFTMLLAAAFAALALALGCVGVYGVMAYSVTRRRRELGVRVALGARPGQVVALVLREGLALAAMGLALGLAGTLVSTRLLESQLFGVTPRDPASYAIAAAALGLVALLSCWLPARRGVAVSPLVALRED